MSSSNTFTVTASKSTLIIASYNCRGLRDNRYDYALRLLQQCDLLFIQEHWISDEQLGSLQLAHPDFYVHGVCGFDSVDVLSGRPYGGCMIMWHRELDLKFSLLETDSRRVCAMTCTSDRVEILFINVYMPYGEDSNSEDDFCLQFSIIEDLIER